MGRSGGGMGVLGQGCIGGGQASEHELKGDREDSGVHRWTLKIGVEKTFPLPCLS